MAKKSSTPQSDPASLAFSAVEDALKDSVFAGLDQPDGTAEKQGPVRPAPREGGNGRTERQRTADKYAAQTGSVANDDRFQHSKILYGLQNRPSQRPTLIAAGVAAVWVVGLVLVALARNGDAIASGTFFGTDEFIGLVALAVIPVLGFFAISTLVRRAQDLHNAATAVTQAAIRLAEPETTASEKVASVGQAVRREVNALGDGLERALSRAGELEVMIHNEVTALERTYSDNESRMRALIQELASQREAVEILSQPPFRQMETVSGWRLKDQEPDTEPPVWGPHVVAFLDMLANWRERLSQLLTQPLKLLIYLLWHAIFVEGSVTPQISEPHYPVQL